MSDDEQATTPDDTRHFPVAKVPIVGIERLIFTPGGGQRNRRVWVQGHVVSLRKAPSQNSVSCCLDDGTAVAWILVSDSLQPPKLGDYVMLIASVHPPSVKGAALFIEAHQLIPLEDPNREVLWWNEMILAHLERSE